jgi:hypothetical protein
MDQATNEFHYAIERCPGAGCSNFMEIGRTVCQNATGFRDAPCPRARPIPIACAPWDSRGMSLRLLKVSGGSVDDYAICRSSCATPRPS